MFCRTLSTSLVLALIANQCTAFAPNSRSNNPLSLGNVNSHEAGSLVRRFYKNREEDESEHESHLSSSLAARTSILHFLTQRSVQSFMFLLKECRDPHTAKWLEEFSESKNLLSYHGTGALSIERFPEWDSFLREMMCQPPDVAVVEVRKNGPTGGLSKNNPYREKEDATIKIDIDIDPPSLAARLLSVREKMGREWMEDLDLVRSANDHIMSSYNKRLKDARSMKDGDEGSEESLASIRSEPKGEDTGESGCGGSFGTTRTNEGSFERFEIYLLSNHPNMNDMGSSPVRASSFDLLFLLSTQESIHRVLKSYMEAGESKAVFREWLNDYYTKNVSKYFDGNQNYGRADDFLDDLLQTPPSLINKEGQIGFVDPLAITEEIIRVRGDVVREWKKMMSYVADDHTELRRELFVLQMAKWGQPIEQPEVEVEERVELVVIEDGLETEWE